MRMLVWAFLGLGVAAVVTAVRGEITSRRALSSALVAMVGAVAGGLVGRVLWVSADAGGNASSAAALVGAVVALGLRAMVFTEGRGRAYA